MRTVVMGCLSHWVCGGYTVLLFAPFVECWHKGLKLKKLVQ